MLPAIASNISPALVSRPDGEETEEFRFVGAYTKDKNSEVISKQGVETLGKLTMEGWFEAVGRSKAMVRGCISVYRCTVMAEEADEMISSALASRTSPHLVSRATTGRTWPC